MKVQWILLFSILITCFTSCVEKNTQLVPKGIQSLEVVDSTVFDVGFFFMPSNSAQYNDRESQQELLFFADPTTYKILKFFSRDGSLHATVDLQQGVDSLPESVIDVEVISLDTIVLLTTHGHLAAINREGRVWKQFNLTQKMGLDADKVHSYEFLSSVFNSKGIIDYKDLILYVSTSLKKKYKDHSEWIIANKANQWNSKQFIRINDLVSDTPTYKLGGELLRSISPKDSNALIIDVFNSYNVYDNKVYITHMFSDKLFIMNSDNMEIVKSKTIQSAYTSLGAPIFYSKNKKENDEVYPKVKKGMKEKGKLGLFFTMKAGNTIIL